MESEYSALSMALRVAIPLLNTIRTVVNGLKLSNAPLTTFKTTVHEDNQSCATLANLVPGRVTPRSKFYALKMHWFRSWLKPNEIEIAYINTKLQKADMLTKSLSTTDFEVNRKLSMGW